MPQEGKVGSEKYQSSEKGDPEKCLGKMGDTEKKCIWGKEKSRKMCLGKTGIKKQMLSMEKRDIEE